jgi:hypothetical protein
MKGIGANYGIFKTLSNGSAYEVIVISVSSSRGLKHSTLRYGAGSIPSGEGIFGQYCRNLASF